MDVNKGPTSTKRTPHLELFQLKLFFLPGVFMQVDMDKFVHVQFHGEMVTKLLEIDCKLYCPYVVEERGGKVMYVE